MKRALLFLVPLLMLIQISAFSQSVPTIMNFQGRLAKPDGTPVPDTSSQTLTFRLFADFGGAALWQQTSNNVAVHNGAFAVSLNFATGYQNGNTLASVFSNPLLTPQLEIQVGSNTPLSPRQTFASVPYALYAGTALSVAPNSITTANLSTSLQGPISLLGNTGAGLLNTVRMFDSNDPPTCLAVCNNIAYVVTRSSLKTFDVSNPVSVPLKGTVPIVSNGSNGAAIAVSGHIAYIVSETPGTLQTVDVSDPANPIALATVTTPTNPVSVAISGNIVCVPGRSKLAIFDVSNPANPILLASQGTVDGTVSVAVAGHIAYVVSINPLANPAVVGSLQIFDISNPANPTLLKSTNTAYVPYSVAVSGNYAYVVNATGSTPPPPTGNLPGTLQIFDVSNPANPISVASVATGAFPRNVVVSGSTAYVGLEAPYSLQTFDVSNPASPVLKSTFSTFDQENYSNLAVSGSYAYICNDSNGSFQIFDALGTLQSNGNLAVVGNITAASATIPVLNGNVGIGTNNAAYPLDVAGTTRMTGFLLPTGAASNSVLTSDGSGNGTWRTLTNLISLGGWSLSGNAGTNSASSFLGTTDNQPLVFKVNGHKAMQYSYAFGAYQSINSLGGSEINSIAAGVVGATIAGGGANGNPNTISNSSGNGDFSTIGGGYNNTVTGNASIIAGGVSNTTTNDLAVVGGGYGNKAGLNATVPGGSSNQAIGRFSFAAGQQAQANNSGSFVWNDTTNAVFADTAPNQFLIHASGGVGINTTNPAGFALNVVGNAKISGSLTVNTTTYTSDARYKTNIVPLNNALDDILNLRGVSYDWDKAKWPEKNFSDGKQIGFIAQELEKIFPELVSADTNGYKSVNYIGVVPVLVEAIKTQQKQIDELKASNVELKAQVKEIDALKKQSAEIVELKKQLAAVLEALKQKQDIAK